MACSECEYKKQVIRNRDKKIQEQNDYIKKLLSYIELLEEVGRPNKGEKE
jgi:hypothetical protein